jgi:hypothetical protein
MEMMSTTYKGVKLPDVIEEDSWFYIIDPHHGYFHGYTPEAALASWKNKVDSVLIREAIESGLYSRDEDSGPLMCLQCGAFVADVHLHTEFHLTH